MAFFLYYLLVAVLPLQIARHFPAYFSRIAGINSDYLTPTLYFTDILVWFFIAAVAIFHPRLKFRIRNTLPAGLFFLWLLFSVFFVAINKEAAFYYLWKITEFTLLFRAITIIKPSFYKTVLFLSLPVVYSSLIVLLQFISQRSLGGYFWYLGERSFYASTPGIAAVSFQGRLLLRPYATFPHPNVFGGFLAIVLPLMIFYLFKGQLQIIKDKKYFMAAVFCGIPALILSFSRSAWIVFAAGLAAVLLVAFKKIRWPQAKSAAVLFSLFFLLSLTLPFMVKSRNQSLGERRELLQSFWHNFRDSPLTGAGLNNSILLQFKGTRVRDGLFLMQPVHNIYLFTAGELGIVGFAGFIALLYFLYLKFRRQPSYRFIPFCLILLLGFFDHYPLTLQQGQLLFVIFSAFALTTD